MARIIIIADDLTGAADCGAAFGELGMEATVLLAGRRERALPRHDVEGAEVVAIDGDTRCLGADQAAEDVMRLVQNCDYIASTEGPVLIFKKIDSTLRGNVGAELAGALRARRARASAGEHVSIVLAPAFPACGRATVNGRQLLNGEALESADVCGREHNRPRSDIAAIVREAGLSCVLVELERVRGGESVLESAMLPLQRTADVVLCDAQTDADLDAIARAARHLDPKTLWAGSAGLARSIARTISSDRSSGLAAKPSVRGPVLYVIGSPAAASREQAQALSAAANLPAFLFSPLDAMRDQTRSQDCAALISKRLQHGGDALVQIESGDLAGAGPGPEVAQCLAGAIATCAPYTGALFATGGETARAILDAWGIRRLRLRGEIEPGVPYATAEWSGREIVVVTKAGGFGTRDTLLRCREFLHACHVRDEAIVTAETTNMHKPIIAITMGDAAGVGPEVIVKSLAHREVYEQCRPLVIGDAQRLRQAERICAAGLAIRSVAAADIRTCEFSPGAIDCVDLNLIRHDLPWGKLAAQAGEAAYQYLAVAAQLAMEGRVAAICTAPLNKEALHAAGHKFPGHTELLAHLTGTGEVSMMLVTPKLKVLHVTTHIGLIDAIAKIEPGLVERTIARGHAALRKSGMENPHIGVCGINPHAGENGLFGHGEEEQKIVPAIRACRERGWNVEGPLPADTLFYRAQRGDFDLVIAMYHDQGHGPVKVLGLEAGVNITIGLPVVRTSVDHGTAFDIAGTGKADERSMLEAIRQAVQLAPR